MKKLLLLICLLPALVLAETEFKIFSLQHRFADDVLPIISPMVGEDGTATGTNNQLIVRAQPERMREIEAMVAQLDAARVNRKITVKSASSVQSQRERVEANGNVRVGKVTVGNSRRARPNSGQIEIENSSSNVSQSANQFINVLDGERGFIRVGQMVPFTQEWVTITRRYVQIDRLTDWRDISTGFAVRPRTVGDPQNSREIELEITPRIARFNGQGFIDFEELTTTIRTRLGEWVDIGGTMQNHDDVSRKILGVSRSAAQENSSLTVKID